MAKQPQRNPSGEADGAPFDGEVSVMGSIARETSTLSAISLDLVAGVGRVGKSKYLVPYIDCDIEGTFFPREVILSDQDQSESDDDDDGETSDSLSIVLSYDNVAFLFAQTAGRYRSLLETVRDLSAGGLRPVPGRIRFIAEALRTASLELASAADEIESLEATPGDGDAPATATPPAAVRPRARKAD